jgi:alpha-tubulin suppressor-like RCC1 family protein
MTRTLLRSSPGARGGALLALATAVLGVACGFAPQPKSGTVACRPQGAACCPEGYLCVGRGLPTAGGPSAGTCFREDDQLPPEAMVGTHDYTPRVLGDPACLVTDWLPPELIGIGTKSDAGTPSQPDAISASWVDAGLDAGGVRPPTPVTSPPALAAGASSTYLVLNGKLLAWGSNGEGKLGDGTEDNRAHPVQVLGLETGVTTVAGGREHACAVVKGGVQCWGQNLLGSLGDGSPEDHRAVPGPVSGLGAGAGATAVAAGDLNTCAVVKGGVQCWGLYGETTTGISYPVKVPGLSGVSVITAGSFHYCALAGGAVRCWGQNADGQLGDGTLKANWTNPVRVVGLDSGVTAISSGYNFNCAVVNGQVRCWGRNNTGQLGDGTTKERTVPVAVVGISETVIDVAAGSGHACAVVDTGTGDGGGVRCWGANYGFQLGVDLGLPNDINNYTEKPVQVTGLTSGVLRMAGGGSHSCARTADGVKCWGSNDSGQLGVEGIGESIAPVDVKLP